MPVVHYRGRMTLTLFFTLLTSLLFAQNTTTITGEVVLDEDGHALEGVTVTLKGAGKATATDNTGKFKIAINSNQLTSAALVFSLVGHQRREIKLSGRTIIRVTLSKASNLMGDVVVTNSYSKPKRKEEVIGSISTISSKELQANRPIESFDKMLEGLVAGVQVEPNSELGTPVRINIRGQNSLTPLLTSNRTALTTSAQPLFIIDGVPIVEQRRGDETIAFLNNEQLLNPLAGINPDDIESLSVLKDAAAVVIYGANASNGVIIITTKKGRAGRTRIGIGYSSGINAPFNRIKWLSGQQYHTLARELYLNEGRSPFDAEILAGSAEINTPWFELTNRYGSFNNIDVDMSGGNDNSQFRVSASYLGQQAIQKGNDLSKFYLRMRLDNQLTRKLRMGITLAPTITKKNALNVYGEVPIVPNVPAYEADGIFYQLGTLLVPNPLAILAQNTAYHEGGSLNGNINFDYTVLKNLRISANFGTDLLVNKLNLFESGQNATGRTKGGFAQIYDRTNFSWIGFGQVNWAPTLKKQHQFDITAGVELQSQHAKLLRGEGSGFSYYRLNELSNAQSQSSASSRQTSNSYSFYGQALYNYKQKYFATVSSRYDAASVFGTDVNSTVNAAVGAGWLLNKEQWFRNYKWLDILRIRASYGTTGNSRIGSYEARGLYEFNNTGYNNLVSAYPSTTANPNLGWEKSYKTNVGIDIGLFNRINITADVYQSIVDDAISLLNIPAENGFPSVLANTARMRNRGFDLNITSQNLIGAFTWSTTFTLGFNKNIIQEVKNKAAFYSSNENASVLRENVSTSAIWGFKWAGVDPATGRELFYDKTGAIVPADALDINMRNAYFLGDRLPKAQGGIVNNLSYKGLTLTFNLLYSIGGYRLINYRNEWNGRNLDNRNQSVNLLDRWQKPGDITTIPRLSRTTRFVTNSSRFLYEDTYLKLSNVTITYIVPKKWTDRLGGVRLTAFVNGTNLIYWYKEASPAGRNGLKEYKFNFPEARSFTWGIRAAF
jgi:TonB-dependent starch-binding outer membrane protein SusC